jgi:Leucine-rich repeat (LRR) protein
MFDEVSLQQLLCDASAVSSRLCMKGLLQLPPLAITALRRVEALDLSGGSLQELPQNFSELQSLRILFASDNNFSRVPPLQSLASLQIIAFRRNRLADLPKYSLPLQLRWLILTDNMIFSIPDEIGKISGTRLADR